MSKLLEYLNQATNPNNNELDVSAVDGFCYILQNEPGLIGEATEKLAFKIQSTNKNESLFALDALEECMNSCGDEFRAKVGKFHFLNELIKLVSKNYLGDQTDETVRNRILDTLFLWTKKYPKETKIKEAYDMLKTQGVVHQPIKNIKTNVQSTTKVSILAASRSKDDENSEMLKKLCHSKNPKDIEEANLWIQNMVREDARRNEIKNKRLLELNKISELIELLDSMLDQYSPETTKDELETIEDQYLACMKTPATIHRLAAETQHSEGLLDKILQTGVKIQEVLQKYETIIVQGKTNVSAAAKVTKKESSDLLTELADSSIKSSDAAPTTDTTLHDLSDVFGSEIPTASSHTPQLGSDILVPQRIEAATTAGLKEKADFSQLTDLMGSFDSKSVRPSSVMHPGKPVAIHQKSEEKKSNQFAADIDSLVLGMRSSLLPSSVTTTSENEETPDEKMLAIDMAATKNGDETSSIDEGTDDQMLTNNMADEKILCNNDAGGDKVAVASAISSKPKSLADIQIDLDSIEPSNLPARVVLEEPKGLKIVLNFAKDRPRADVSVIVVSTTNEGPECISNYQFDAAVSKPCKVRLLTPSGNNLVGSKPFRPPADGITQVLLLSNPTTQPTNMVCILSYCIGDDPDPIRETCDVKNIPLHSN